MKKARRQRFEHGGWKIGSASELLGLTEAEEALVEAKLRLGQVVRTLRQRRHLTQAGLARLIGSSQSRIAKLENQDPDISLDLQMKAVFAASPEALRDFQRLVDRWGAGTRSRRSADAVADEHRRARLVTNRSVTPAPRP